MRKIQVALTAPAALAAPPATPVVRTTATAGTGPALLRTGLVLADAATLAATARTLAAATALPAHVEIRMNFHPPHLRPGSREFACLVLGRGCSLSERVFFLSSVLRRKRGGEGVQR